MISSRFIPSPCTGKLSPNKIELSAIEHNPFCTAVRSCLETGNPAKELSASRVFVNHNILPSPFLQLLWRNVL
jgi:hypothetical protein